jgi:hypothetical protein
MDIQPWPAPKSVMSRMTRCRRRALVSARLFRRLPVSDARIVEPGGDEERGIHSTARWPTAPLHLRGLHLIDTGDGSGHGSFPRSAFASLRARIASCCPDSEIQSWVQWPRAWSAVIAYDADLMVRGAPPSN